MENFVGDIVVDIWYFSGVNLARTTVIQTFSDKIPASLHRLQAFSAVECRIFVVLFAVLF